jgi:hypothetical protein
MPLNLNYTPLLPRHGLAYLVRHTSVPDLQGRRITTVLGVVEALEHAAAYVYDRWGEFIGSDAGWECMSYAAVRARYGLDLRTERHAWDTIYVRALSEGGCVTVELCDVLPAAKAYPTNHDLIAEHLRTAEVLHAYHAPRTPITVHRFQHTDTPDRPETTRMARVVYTAVGHYIGYEDAQGSPVWVWAIERNPDTLRYTRSIPSHRTMEAALMALLVAKEAIAKHHRAGTLSTWEGNPHDPAL